MGTILIESTTFSHNAPEASGGTDAFKGYQMGYFCGKVGKPAQGNIDRHAHYPGCRVEVVSMLEG